MDDLDDRVKNFYRLALPGQPIGMHMGTLHLINDLWREILRLRECITPDRAEARAGDDEPRAAEHDG